jgi:hypothetical protein
MAMCSADAEGLVMAGRDAGACPLSPTAIVSLDPESELVERDAVRDLVEPRTGVLGLLQRVVVAVRLDERVLGQVRRELRVADHAQQVRVDLAVVAAEQLLDERAGGRLVPAAHDTPGGADRGVVRDEVECHEFPWRTTTDWAWAGSGNRSRTLRKPKTPRGRRV